MKASKEELKREVEMFKDLFKEFIKSYAENSKDKVYTFSNKSAWIAISLFLPLEGIAKITVLSLSVSR